MKKMQIYRQIKNHCNWSSASSQIKEIMKFLHKKYLSFKVSNASVQLFSNLITFLSNHEINNCEESSERARRSLATSGAFSVVNSYNELISNTMAFGKEFFTKQYTKKFIHLRGCGRRERRRICNSNRIHTFSKIFSEPSIF